MDFLPWFIGGILVGIVSKMEDDKK